MEGLPESQSQVPGFSCCLAICTHLKWKESSIKCTSGQHAIKASSFALTFSTLKWENVSKNLARAIKWKKKNNDLVEQKNSIS